MTVPAQAPVINVEVQPAQAPDVRVEVQPPAAPDIRVEVAGPVINVPAPVVTVLPRRGTTVKEIEFDDKDRMKKITEHEED